MPSRLEATSRGLDANPKLVYWCARSRYFGLLNTVRIKYGLRNKRDRLEHHNELQVFSLSLLPGKA